MEKKYFWQPTMKVVRIANNIIATSGVADGASLGTKVMSEYDSDDNQFVGGRRGWDEY